MPGLQESTQNQPQLLLQEHPSTEHQDFLMDNSQEFQSLAKNPLWEPQGLLTTGKKLIFCHKTALNFQTEMEWILPCPFLMCC